MNKQTTNAAVKNPLKTNWIRTRGFYQVWMNDDEELRKVPLRANITDWIFVSYINSRPCDLADYTEVFLIKRTSKGMWRSLHSWVLTTNYYNMESERERFLHVKESSCDHHHVLVVGCHWVILNPWNSFAYYKPSECLSPVEIVFYFLLLLLNSVCNSLLVPLVKIGTFVGWYFVNVIRLIVIRVWEEFLEYLFI